MGEIDPGSVNTKYKVGDLLYATDDGSLHKLDAITEDGGLYLTTWTQIYPVDIPTIPTNSNGYAKNVEFVLATSIDEAIAKIGQNDNYEERLITALDNGDGVARGLATYSIDYGWQKLIESGGATIHVEAGTPGEIGPSYVNTKYKVGDLLYATDDGSLHKLDSITEDEGLYYTNWTQIYPDDSPTVEGYENPVDSDAPTANQRAYYRGEWSGYLLSGYGPAIIKYEGDLYFSDGNHNENLYPNEKDSGWIKLTGADGTGFVWCGEWDENKNYNHGDAVSYEGSSYISTDDIPEGMTPDASLSGWELLAEKGANGKDYVLTEADKTEMVNAVLSALPKWEGGSY